MALAVSPRAARALHPALASWVTRCQVAGIAVAPEVLEVFRAVEEVARVVELHRAASSYRSAAVVDAGAATGAESLPMTTTQVADVLEVTPRRVRQLAVDGLGSKCRGRWQFARAAVEAKAAARTPRTPL